MKILAAAAIVLAQATTPPPADAPPNTPPITAPVIPSMQAFCAAQFSAARYPNMSDAVRSFTIQDCSTRQVPHP